MEIGRSIIGLPEHCRVSQPDKSSRIVVNQDCVAGEQRQCAAVRFTDRVCGEIFTANLLETLDNASAGLKYRTIRKCPSASGNIYEFHPAAEHYSHSYPQSEAMDQKCLHPRVQVVSRDEDAEFVECLECREIFESSEFRDMDIEAKIPTEEE